MFRIGPLTAFVAFAVSGPAVAQPRIIEMQPPPVSLRLLEESAEQLEAALDVKKAYVKAAEVAVAATKSQFNLLAAGNPARAEIDRAKHELEAAEALLGIRKAEMREVEVRLKQVMRRLDEAKSAAPPKPRIAPPKPDRPDLIDMAIRASEIQTVRDKVERLKASLDLARANLSRTQKLVQAGLIAEKDFLQAQQAATIAELDLLLARAELQVLEVKRQAREDEIPAPRPK